MGSSEKKREIRLYAAVLVAMFIFVAVLSIIDGINKKKEKPYVDGEKVVLLCTGDVRGSAESYGKAAALKKHYEDENSYVLLLDGGNALQGHPMANENRGLYIII